MTTPDPTTEEKIKSAARELFHQKGFEGTRTRDIAEAAGINLALMNYYFRSKKKLFELIMLETIETFFQSIVGILRDEALSTDQKIKNVSSHYIEMLLEEPDLPIFILSEMRTNPSFIIDNIIKDKKIRETPLFQFLQQNIRQDTANPGNPAHILINFISMTIFPFAAKPLIEELFELNDDQFRTLMKDRKDLIPVWVGRLLPPEAFTQIKGYEE